MLSTEASVIELKYLLILVTALAGAIGTFLDVYNGEGENKKVSIAGKTLVSLIVITLVLTLIVQGVENKEQETLASNREEQYRQSIDKMNSIIDDLSSNIETSQHILKSVGKIDELNIHVLYKQALTDESSVIGKIVDDVGLNNNFELCNSNELESSHGNNVEFLKYFSIQCNSVTEGFYAHYWPEDYVFSDLSVPEYWKQLRYQGLIIVDRSNLFNDENVVLDKNQYASNIYLSFSGDYRAILESKLDVKSPLAKISYYPKANLASVHAMEKLRFNSEDQVELDADVPFNSTDFITTEMYLAIPKSVEKMVPYLVLFESDKYKRVTYTVTEKTSNITNHKGMNLDLQLYKLTREKDPFKAYERQNPTYFE